MQQCGTVIEADEAPTSNSVEPTVQESIRNHPLMPILEVRNSSMHCVILQEIEAFYSVIMREMRRCDEHNAAVSVQDERRRQGGQVEVVSYSDYRSALPPSAVVHPMFLYIQKLDAES